MLISKACQRWARTIEVTLPGWEQLSQNERISSLGRKSTYSSHKLFLTTPGDSHSARSLPPTKNRVLGCAKGCFRRVLIYHLRESVTQGLALTVKEHMYPLDWMLEPCGNRRWGDILEVSSNIQIEFGVSVKDHEPRVRCQSAERRAPTPCWGRTTPTHEKQPGLMHLGHGP